ncbi:g8018 [Coccomyxa viridis]|uniref:G8018 protein n=1 Tax=Coccomyxa viridis TaxID=1274662 RepID=A0ABP1FZD1_9CHLO
MDTQHPCQHGTAPAHAQAYAADAASAHCSESHLCARIQMRRDAASVSGRASLPPPLKKEGKATAGRPSSTGEQILSTPPQQQHIWQLGLSSFSTRFIDAPARMTAYIDAFRRLHPHRLVAVEDLAYHEVMSQPLFHSW